MARRIDNENVEERNVFLINIYLFTTLVSLSGRINDWAGERKTDDMVKLSASFLERKVDYFCFVLRVCLQIM